MKRTLVLILAVVLMSPVIAGAEAVKWITLKEGTEKARLEKKPMIVDFFFGKGCPRCELLEKNVYSDPAIAGKIMADFVPVRVDLTKPLTKEEEALGDKFDYKKDCLLVFLDPEGEVFTDKAGKRLCFIDKVDPEWFVEYLDTIREKMKERTKQPRV